MSHFMLCRIAALVGVCFAPGFIHAATITDGDVEINDSLRIATTDDGSVTVTPPTELEFSFVEVGIEPGRFGTLTVDGGKVNSHATAIGITGVGTINVINGGKYSSGPTSSPLVLGATHSGEGTLFVSGDESLFSAPGAPLDIGNHGIGNFVLEHGARARVGQARLAIQSEGLLGFGSATVRGPGSRWDIDYGLTVGDRGIADLHVADGGRIDSGIGSDNSPAWIGNFEGADGRVHVEGNGSLWRHDGPVTVGFGGSGSVNISDGGRIISRELSVGRAFGGRAGPGEGIGRVSIDGPGSEWITGSLEVGRGGDGELVVSNGGALKSHPSQGFDGMVLGSEFGSQGRIVIDGPTSRWLSNAHELVIGQDGVGEFEIRNGARVTHGDVYLGMQHSGSGEVDVVGVNSEWVVNSLHISGDFNNGGFGRVRLRDGGTLRVNSQNSQDFINGRTGEILLDNGSILGFSNAGETPLQNLGMLAGDGDIHLPVTNEAEGRIYVGPSQKLTLRRGLKIFRAQTDVRDGELEVHSELHNRRGIVTMENSTVRLVSPPSSSASIRNSGQFFIAGGTNRIFADFTNSFSLGLTGNSHSTFFSDFSNFGNMSISAGSSATILGEFSGNGAQGGGTVFLEGGVAPGESPGAMHFGGDVSLGAASELAIELAGSGEGEFDRVSADGNLRLGGRLALEALAPFDDSTLSILTADNLLDGFADLPELHSHLGAGMFLTGIEQTGDELSITVEAGYADFNLDGVVNRDDLTIWEVGFGTSGATLATGDANGDGHVNGSDFLIWQRKAAGHSALDLVATSHAVPEPSAMLLMIMGFAMLIQKGDTLCPRIHP